MNTAFLALGNYFITLLLFAFDAQTFWCLYRQEEPKGWKSIVRKVEMVAIFVLCYHTLYLRTGEVWFYWFFVIQLAAYALLSVAYRKLYPKLSGLLFDLMLLLLGVGGVMLSRLDPESAFRQFAIVVAALVAALFIPGFIRSMHRLERYGFWYLALGLIILLLVFLFAGERLGARIWVKILGVPMQPFEFVKLSFIFGCAAVLLRAKKWYEKAAVFVLAGAHVLIMVASKDLGGALLFALVFWLLLYACDGRKLWLFGGIAGGGIACALAYKLFYHVRVRVLAWKDPFSVVDNEGYQLSQSLFAIGNGGFFGTGLYAGAPEQIPVVTTDYIFSAICEEMGALFALGVLFVYVICLFLLIRMTKRFTEDYYRIVFTGFAGMFTAQILLNVGGVIRMIPSTGVPLPFVSAGGSSAASMVLMFMLIQGMQERTGEKNGTKAGSERKAYKDGFVPGTLLLKARRATEHCMAACCILLLFVAAYFTVFSLTEARGVIFHSYNRRQEKLSEQNAKGTIYDRNGNPLAVTLLLDGEEVRKYPYGRLFSHVVGQTQYGKSGLESICEIELLTASVGEFTKLSYRIRGAQLPGNNLFTTLNATIQNRLVELLEEGGTNPAAGCVIDLSTGGLVASVSLPDYVPEKAKEYEAADNAPLFNRTFYGEYAVFEGSGLLLEMADCFPKGIPTPFGDVIPSEKRFVTPVAAAMFAGACANMGTCPKVYVEEKLTDAGGRVIYRNESESVELMTEAEAEALLGKFTKAGTQEPSILYRLERIPTGTGASFHLMGISLVPENEPRYAVCMVLENCTKNDAEAEMISKLTRLGEMLP